MSMYLKAYVRVGEDYEEVQGLVFNDKKLCVIYSAEDDGKYKKFKRKIPLVTCIPLDSAEIISEKDYWHKKKKK